MLWSDLAMSLEGAGRERMKRENKRQYILKEMESEGSEATLNRFG